MLLLHDDRQGHQLARQDILYFRFGEAVAAFLRGRRERLAGFALAFGFAAVASLDSLPASTSATLCFRFDLLDSLCTLSLSPARELLLLVSESSSPPEPSADSSVFSHYVLFDRTSSGNVLSSRFIPVSFRWWYPPLP
jgi:hypothetical protein